MAVTQAALLPPCWLCVLELEPEFVFRHAHVRHSDPPLDSLSLLRVLSSVFFTEMPIDPFLFWFCFSLSTEKSSL